MSPHPLKLIMIKLLLKTLLLVCVIWSEAEIAAALAEGDVRLVRQPNFTMTAARSVGKLDIYLKGKWSTFCGLSGEEAWPLCVDNLVFLISLH